MHGKTWGSTVLYFHQTNLHAFQLSVYFTGSWWLGYTLLKDPSLFSRIMINSHHPPCMRTHHHLSITTVKIHNHNTSRPSPIETVAGESPRGRPPVPRGLQGRVQALGVRRRRRRGRRRRRPNRPECRPQGRGRGQRERVGQGAVAQESVEGSHQPRIHQVGRMEDGGKWMILEIQGRVTLVVAYLGWVDFDLDVPLFCLATQPVLPNSHWPKQNWTDGGTSKFMSTQPGYVNRHPGIRVQRRMIMQKFLSFLIRQSKKHNVENIFIKRRICILKVRPVLSVHLVEQAANKPEESAASFQKSRQSRTSSTCCCRGVDGDSGRGEVRRKDPGGPELPPAPAPAPVGRSVHSFFRQHGRGVE